MVTKLFIAILCEDSAAYYVSKRFKFFVGFFFFFDVVFLCFMVQVPCDQMAWIISFGKAN